jgi:hypothetical protein
MNTKSTLRLELFPKAENMFGRKGSLIYRFLGGKHVGSLEGSEWRRHRKVKQYESIFEFSTNDLNRS